MVTTPDARVKRTLANGGRQDGDAGRVWSVDAAGYWAEVAGPLPPLLSGSPEEVERQVEDAGYSRVLALGREYGPLRVTLFRHERGDFWAQLWIGDDGFDVLLDTLPALWRFLLLAVPLVRDASTLED
jgi:hypothetical protein